VLVINEPQYALDMLLKKIGESSEHDFSNSSSITLKSIAVPVRKEPSLRHEQIVKERCQAVAKLLWRQNPDYTTTELCTHADIRNEDITDGIRFQPRTIYDWLAAVDPRAQKDKVGRPPNKLKNIRNNLRS
jgi:hypothetical protein